MSYKFKFIAVTGGRHFANRDLVFTVLGYEKWMFERDDKYNNIVLIHGDAKGADALAKEWADLTKTISLAYPVGINDWDNFGIAAGPIRNKNMLSMFPTVDKLIWFTGGAGTENCKSYAKSINIPVVSAWDVYAEIENQPIQNKRIPLNYIPGILLPWED